MIITKEILEALGSCQESVEHFVAIVGNNDPKFSISYDDALRYLATLRDKDANTYSSWYTFVEQFATNSEYQKISGNFQFGKYTIPQYGLEFDSLEECTIKNNDLYVTQQNEYLSSFSDILKITAIVNEPNTGETLIPTDVELNVAKQYLVFNPLLGTYTHCDDFNQATHVLNTITNSILTQIPQSSICRQIMRDGIVVALDVIEST